MMSPYAGIVEMESRLRLKINDWELGAELDCACSAALEAGAIALRAFTSRDFEVEEKAGGLGPVTTADLEANAAICEALAHRFPDDAIIAEESVPAGDEGRRRWFVDPIDGTREFAAGRREFAVMIGLCVDGVPVVGVVTQPATRAIVIAHAGHGAFSAFVDTHELASARTRGDSLRGTSVLGSERNPIDWSAQDWQQLRVSTVRKPTKATLMRSRSSPSKRVDRLVQLLEIPNQRSMGSLGLKIVEIASGRADLYCNFKGKASQWDIAGPQAILEAAGGRMTTARGEPLLYAARPTPLSEGVVASNSLLHDAILAAVT